MSGGYLPVEKHEKVVLGREFELGHISWLFTSEKHEKDVLGRDFQLSHISWLLYQWKARKCWLRTYLMFLLHGLPTTKIVALTVVFCRFSNVELKKKTDHKSTEKLLWGVFFYIWFFIIPSLSIGPLMRLRFISPVIKDKTWKLVSSQMSEHDGFVLVLSVFGRQWSPCFEDRVAQTI